MEQRHGSPYDRGWADRYYGRPYTPHFFEGATYSSPEVTEVNMTPEQIEEYRQGWNDNQEDRKDWGDGDYAPYGHDM